MNHCSTSWRCMIILLTFSSEHLLSAESMGLVQKGHLTVGPANPVRMGSNLTVVCHADFRRRQEWLDISLEVNNKSVDSGTSVNRTAKLFRLREVSVPVSTLICRLRIDQQSHFISGLQVQAGLPPDKPGNISCATTRSSAVIDCSWTTGRQTYIDTFYNVTIHQENGTRLHFHLKDKTVTICRRMLDENTKYLLNITAYNHFGVSHSDPFSLSIRDTVIPETPLIMQVDFKNDSTEATLQWETSESSADLEPFIRLRTDNVSWAAKEGTELGGGQVRVKDLRPLTEYEFQIRTCVRRTSVSQSNTSIRPLCSRWSPSKRKTSPGKGPSQQLDVWRTLGGRETDGMQMVTVAWKPPPPEDYSGALQQFRILWATDRQHEVTCSAAVTQWSGQVSSDVQTLTVSAVTSYGASPPAEVTLRHSDILGPVLRDLVPAPNGSAVLVSWLWFVNTQPSTVETELLCYVLEWKLLPAGGLQWKKLTRDKTNTSIAGLTAGVRYNVSLHAVTTGGLSAPSSRLTYSSEKAPVSGPNISVLAHETRRILVQWDELPVEQQRGFITKYTVYLHSLDDGRTERNVPVSASGLRQMWLDCPEGALTLRMTASTSAGEGPPGRQISSQSDAPAVDLVIVVVFTITVFGAIIANLMCWSCVRKRVKEICLSLGLNWLVENLPKPDRSNAIKLLEQMDGSEPLVSSVHSDPPLSPITVVSPENRDEVYPTVHIEPSQIGSGRPIGETPSLTSDTSESHPGNCDYKPQLLSPSCQEPEPNDAEDKQSDDPADQEEDRRLLDGLLRELRFEFPNAPLGLTYSSATGLLRPTTTETSVFHGGVIQERSAAEEGPKAEFFSLDLKQDDITTPDTTDTSWSECMSELALNGGYFPQVAAPQPDTLR